MKNLLLIYIFIGTHIVAYAGIGLGEWEHTLCGKYVFSNSDIYDEKPVLLTRENNIEIILVNRVLNVKCFGDYIIGNFQPYDKLYEKYFLINKSVGNVEEFPDIKSLNNRISSLDIIPFYAKPLYNENRDIFKQIEFIRLLDYVLFFTLIVSVFIVLKIIKRKIRNKNYPK